jgi:hypothetical protein
MSRLYLHYSKPKSGLKTVILLYSYCHESLLSPQNSLIQITWFYAETQHIFQALLSVICVSVM